MACKKKGKAEGGSVASKGMKAGGPTSMDRKNFGRNMSRVKNQRGK